jgi:uncharacterized membrane protein
MSIFDQLRSILPDIHYVFDIRTFASTCGGSVNKRFLTLINFVGTGTLVLGAAGLLFAGYVFVKEIPDLKRYIKISRM